jgi:uncharacterized protein YegP (UPF0339 family)
MVATFETTKDTEGRLRFRRTAANGEVIAYSPEYASKAAADNGIAWCRRTWPRQLSSTDRVRCR